MARALMLTMALWMGACSRDRPHGTGLLETCPAAPCPDTGSWEPGDRVTNWAGAPCGSAWLDKHKCDACGVVFLCVETGEPGVYATAWTPVEGDCRCIDDDGALAQGCRQ